MKEKGQRPKEGDDSIDYTLAYERLRACSRLAE